MTTDERLPTGVEFEPHPLQVGVVIRAVVRERAMVRRPCVCGGTIRGNRFEPTVYVVAHNRSTAHQEWRAERGL